MPTIRSMDDSLQNSGRIAAHADWSVDPAKRWITRAARARHGWTIEAPEPVGDAGTLLARLLHAASGAPVAFGGDFPLGLPRAYADLRGITDFAGWLRRLDPASPFFTVCDTIDQVSLDRPFYPRGTVSGSGHMARHAERLGLSVAEFRRVVDRPIRVQRPDGTVKSHPGGAPLFWTLGANQCGKGALNAWKTCIIPGLAAGMPLDLWPFAGDFGALLRPGRIVVAETYPAAAMIQLGLKLKGSKRSQPARAALAEAIHARLDALQAEATPELRRMIDEGFGAAASGEDRFDSLMGVLCVIRVIDGAPDGVPDDPAIRTVEGWVLGRIKTDPALPIPSAPPSPGRRPMSAPRSRPAGPPPAGSG